MQAPSVSVRDILDAARKCKEVYDAFKHPQKNAHRRFARFRAELERVEMSLQTQQSIIRWTGAQYPGAQAFNELLQECTDYMSGKKPLLQEPQRGNRSAAVIQQTVLSVFDREMPRLKEELHYQRQEFSDWKMDVLLQHVLQHVRLPDGAHITTTNSRIPGSQPNDTESSSDILPVVDNVQKVYDGLVPLLLNYRKVAESATTEVNETSSQIAAADRFEASLCTTISSICRLENFPDDYRPPSTFLQRLSELSDETGTNELNAPPGSQSTSRMKFPRYFRILINVPEYRRKPLQAASYIVIGRRCIFHNVKQRVIFEHRLSDRCCPNTFHERFAHPHTVDFLDEQDVSIFESSTKSPANEASMMAHVQYIFMTEEERQTSDSSDPGRTETKEQENRATQARMRFQSDLRSKQLLREFHVNAIYSKNSISGPDIYFVCIKLWHDTMEPYYTTLSAPEKFGSSRTQQRKLMYEWSLHWFKIKERKKGSKFVILEFLTGQPGNLSLPSIANSTSSRTTAKSTGSLSREEMSTDFASLKWINQVTYLKFEFESSDEAAEFAVAVGQAQIAKGRPPSDSSSPPPSELTSISSSSSSIAASRSPLSVRSRPTNTSTTTVGTSPMLPDSPERTPSRRSPPQIPEFTLDRSPLMGISASASEDDQWRDDYQRYMVALPPHDARSSTRTTSTPDGSFTAETIHSYAPRDVLDVPRIQSQLNWRAPIEAPADPAADQWSNTDRTASRVDLPPSVGTDPEQQDIFESDTLEESILEADAIDQPRNLTATFVSHAEPVRGLEQGRSATFRKVQGSWTCRCGSRIEDTFFELSPGTVASAMEELSTHNGMQQGPAAGSTVYFQSARLILSDRLNDLRSFANTASNRWRKKNEKDHDDHGSGPNASRDLEMQDSVREPDTYLFVCVTTNGRWRKTRMVPLHMASHNDKMLFQLLRREYLTIVGFWRRLLGIMRIRCIRFVKFQMTAHPIYTIYKHSEEQPPQVEILPPSRHTDLIERLDWFYNPNPANFIPPVGSEALVHLFTCPEACQDRSYCKNRFPKHVRDKPFLANDEDEVASWGIELTEGCDWAFLWLVGLIIILSSMLFGILWALLMNDIQGGFTVSSYMVGAAVCFMGTIQSALERL